MLEFAAPLAFRSVACRGFVREDSFLNVITGVVGVAVLVLAGCVLCD